MVRAASVVTTEQRTTRRRNLRHGAAALRAVSGVPTAEWRGGRLRVDGRTVAIATPYLMALSDDAVDRLDERRCRGIADGLALLLRHNDPALHAEVGPEPLLERMVFDAFEQMRCDSLAPVHLRGLRANLTAAFDGWSLDARASGVAESRTAMLVFTVVHMVAARLHRRTLPADVEELTEATRFHLAPVIGHALRELPQLCSDQRRFAVAAAEIARLVAEVTGDATESEIIETASRHRLLVPMEWADTDDMTLPTAETRDGVGGATSHADPCDLDSVGDYRVFTRDFDREVGGATLYRPAKLAQLRAELDRMVLAQAISVPRLAARLLALLGGWDDDDWTFGRDHGVLDRRRLSHLVMNPNDHELFKQRRRRRTGNAAVTFLIDNSGSMKRQRFQAVATIVDTFCRALDLAGIANEVLGFTTGAWAGGRPMEEWRLDGEPRQPGRMNEVLHIVYKSADASWRRSRDSLAALVSPRHFREGLDGEALAWTHHRLTARPEPRRILVMISDGAPLDAATANVNRPGYLDDHLVGVADRIERHHAVTGRGIELRAIGIERDMRAYVRKAIDLDLSGTLALAHYSAVYHLLR